MTHVSTGAEPRPGAGSIFKLFFLLGLQSFGGGIATFTMIHDHTVERLGWITEEEFVHSWAMVQLAPGINLLALVILIGRRACGMRGAFAALLGLMLPSCGITVLIASLYGRVHNAPGAVSAIRGAVPAIVALGLLSCVTMARPLLKPTPTALNPQPRSHTVFAVILMAASGAAVIAQKASIPAVLLMAGAAGAAHAVLTTREGAHGGPGD
jgi:chromate transporter